MTDTTTNTGTRPQTQSRLEANDLAMIRAVVATASPMLGNVALRRCACAAIGRTWCEMRDAELYLIDEIVHDAISSLRASPTMTCSPQR